jgi:hypothetical protein
VSKASRAGPYRKLIEIVRESRPDYYTCFTVDFAYLMLANNGQGGQLWRKSLDLAKRYERRLNEAARESVARIDREIEGLASLAFACRPTTQKGLAAQALMAMMASTIVGQEPRAKALARAVIDLAGSAA